MGRPVPVQHLLQEHGSSRSPVDIFFRLHGRLRPPPIIPAPPRAAMDQRRAEMAVWRGQRDTQIGGGDGGGCYVKPCIRAGGGEPRSCFGSRAGEVGGQRWAEGGEMDECVSCYLWGGHC